jgi:hypothetical protein
VGVSSLWPCRVPSLPSSFATRDRRVQTRAPHCPHHPGSRDSCHHREWVCGRWCSFHPLSWSLAGGKRGSEGWWGGVGLGSCLFPHSQIYAVLSFTVHRWGWIRPRSCLFPHLPDLCGAAVCWDCWGGICVPSCHSPARAIVVTTRE